MEANQAGQLHGLQNPRRRGTWLIPSVISVLFLLVATIVILPSFGTPCERSPRIDCSANLRRIGQALYIYAQDYPDGNFPDDIGQIILQGNAKPEGFICPLNGSATSSYLYVRGGTILSDPETVIIFENPLNHSHANPKHQGGFEGGNVLFQDSHVTFVRRNELKIIIDKATATGRVVQVPDVSKLNPKK